MPCFDFDFSSRWHSVLSLTSVVTSSMHASLQLISIKLQCHLVNQLFSSTPCSECLCCLCKGVESRWNRPVLGLMRPLVTPWLVTPPLWLLPPQMFAPFELFNLPHGPWMLPLSHLLQLSHLLLNPPSEFPQLVATPQKLWPSDLLPHLPFILLLLVAPIGVTASFWFLNHPHRYCPPLWLLPTSDWKKPTPLTIIFPHRCYPLLTCYSTHGCHPLLTC